jgi:hypothetical protein
LQKVDKTLPKPLKTKYSTNLYEKKFTKMEKERPNALEMAKKKTQKRKA